MCFNLKWTIWYVCCIQETCDNADMALDAWLFCNTYLFITNRFLIVRIIGTYRKIPCSSTLQRIFDSSSEPK